MPQSSNEIRYSVNQIQRSTSMNHIATEQSRSTNKNDKDTGKKGQPRYF